MTENKTRPTQSSVTSFLDKVEDKSLREDCFSIVKMMEEVSHSDAVMWGNSIVGCGLHHYVYESGREGDTVIIGFSPRKQNIAIYLLDGISKLESELAALGKHKTGKGCLYIKSLRKVNLNVLKGMFRKAFEEGHHKNIQATNG